MTQPSGKKKKEHQTAGWAAARKNRKGPTGPNHAQLRKEKKESWREKRGKNSII